MAPRSHHNASSAIDDLCTRRLIKSRNLKLQQMPLTMIHQYCYCINLIRITPTKTKKNKTKEEKKYTDNKRQKQNKTQKEKKKEEIVKWNKTDKQNYIDEQVESKITTRLLIYLFDGLGLWCLVPLSTIFQLCPSWRSVLLVEETGVLGENHWPVSSISGWTKSHFGGCSQGGC